MAQNPLHFLPLYPPQLYWGKEKPMANPNTLREVKEGVLRGFRKESMTLTFGEKISHSWGHKIDCLFGKYF